jgi:hypothetical protein
VTVRAPIVVAALVGSGGVLWGVAVGVDREPLAADSALAVAIGFVLLAVIAVTALLLVRAPLGRWLGYVVLGSGMASHAVLDLGALGWIAAAVSAAGITGLTGPWLKVWLRGRPAAVSVGWQAPLLILGAIALVPLVGLAAPEGLSLAHGVLAGGGLLLAWGYARARIWALWGLRLLLLPAAALAAATTPRAAGIAAVAAAALALTALAWSTPARRAIGIPAPVLPAPHRRRSHGAS